MPKIIDVTRVLEAYGLNSISNRNRSFTNGKVLFMIYYRKTMIPKYLSQFVIIFNCVQLCFLKIMLSFLWSNLKITCFLFYKISQLLNKAFSSRCFSKAFPTIITLTFTVLKFFGVAYLAVASRFLN